MPINSLDVRAISMRNEAPQVGSGTHCCVYSSSSSSSSSTSSICSGICSHSQIDMQSTPPVLWWFVLVVVLS